MAKCRLTVIIDTELKDFLIAHARRKKLTMGEVIENSIREIKTKKKEAVIE